MSNDGKTLQLTERQLQLPTAAVASDVEIQRGRDVIEEVGDARVAVVHRCRIAHDASHLQSSVLHATETKLPQFKKYPIRDQF